jgi:uncharacterized membrane protein YphA (DoxX/SURF4 family)
MKLVQQLSAWSQKSQSGFTDGLRIVLGLILFVKGYQLMFNMATVVQTIQYEFGYSSVWFVQALAAIHLFAGIFIVIGAATRLASFVMIPIVSVAILFVNSNITEHGTGELLLSIASLFLLVFFLIAGNGRFSVYYYIINSKRSRNTDESKVEYKSN